jgi:VWFA-related protein
MRKTLLLPLLLVALIPSSVMQPFRAASAQEKPQTPPPQPTFRVEANFIRVDVYPTADGRMVPDLKREDFEILEDGKPQQVSNFEYIVVRPAGSTFTRIEPNSVAESRQLASDPRHRVFVLFLDTYHAKLASSRIVSKPIAKMLERVIGQDDLIATMTPEMAAADISLARRTETLEEILDREWWGRRDRLADLDEVEEALRACFDRVIAPDPGEAGNPARPSISPERAAQLTEANRTLLRELVARRREKLSLDALQDLVRHLRGVREERKAIFVISEGWLLYRPNASLTRMLDPNAPAPGIPEIFVGPDGKLTTKDTRRFTTSTMYECERDRMFLANLDNEQHFRDIMGEANHANASFYTVDPRGLPAWDSDIGPDPPPPLRVDQQILFERQNNLRALAAATDGVAVMNNNDIARGLQRVVNDLTSYYLLGYYSTNTKLDGKFRNIKVRVKRPGVEVRARRGYRAATPEEMSGGTARGTAPAAPTAPSAVEHTISRLASIRPESKFHVTGGTLPPADEGAPGRVWVVGELDYTVARQTDWASGGEAEITVSAGAKSIGTTKVTLPPGARTLSANIPIAEPVTTETVRVSVRVRPAAGGLPVVNVAQIAWPKSASAAPADPLLFRRGPTTGQKYDPTADYRFRRSERVRVQIPIAGVEPTAAGRMLDRAGKPLQVPVTTSVQRDAEGAWVVAEAALSPLAAGDYALEVTLTRGEGKSQQQVLVPVRIVP